MAPHDPRHQPLRFLRLLLASLLTAGCAGRLSSGSGLASLGKAGIPEAPAERRRAALFDSDLGPDTVDVSAYPARQQRNYAVYARVCSHCHTLARSINSPFVNQGWWNFYVSNMRMRLSQRGESMGEHDVDAILEFLEYDSNERKADRAVEFEKIRAELKRRFDAEMSARIDNF